MIWWEFTHIQIIFWGYVYGVCHSTSCVSSEGSLAYFVVVVIGSLLTINWCFFVIYTAHAILRAALVARGGHCLFYNSVRYTRHMPFSGNAPSPSPDGRSSGLIKYELRSCSPSSRATSVARGSIAYFNSDEPILIRHLYLLKQQQIKTYGSAPFLWQLPHTFSLISYLQFSYTASSSHRNNILSA